MEALKKHAHVLKTMSRLKPKALKGVIHSAKPDLIYVLCDICHNILRGNVNLSPLHKKRLKVHRHRLRTLANQKGSVKQKKKLLQKGGLIGALLRPILGLLGSFLGN